jgi:hypothetical protein
MSNDLEKLFERLPPLDEDGNPVDLDKQIAKFRAMRAAEQQARMAGPLRCEQERAVRAAAKLAEREQRAAERERLKAEKARLKTEAKAAKERAKVIKKTGGQQLDLIETVNNSA